MMKQKLLMAGAFAALAVAVACSEDIPTSPNTTTSGPVAEPSRASVVAALSCNADVVAREIICDAPVGQPLQTRGGREANILLGGQDLFVAVKTSNVNYDGGTGAFTFDATVRNLIPQPLGTKDTLGGLTPDPAGVRVFFSSGPNVTNGTGLITVTGDGTSTFTAPNQPYYQYNAVLEQFEISAPKTWQLNMPNTVLNFSFLLLVSAEVPRPAGYIDLQVATLKPPTDRQVSWTLRNANGTINTDPTPITWSVSDTTRATIDANGVVNPLRAGSVTIIAQQGSKIGYLTKTVLPIRRLWQGTTNNQWAVGTNWYPDGVKPVPTDTAMVHDSIASGVFPVLTQNEDVAGVEVDDITPGGTIPTVSINAFNLNASGDVFTTNSGNINGSSGQLILSGISNTVRGLVPRVNVIGRYSLNGNMTAQLRIQVQGGRLQNTGFRIQQNPN